MTTATNSTATDSTQTPPRSDVPFNRIAVGIDGSPGSATALRWAIAEALYRKAELMLIHSWRYPIGYGLETTAYVQMDQASMERAGRTLVDEMVAEVTAQLTASGLSELPPISIVVQEGPAAQRLSEAGKNVDLLVVGARGHGGFMGLLLGSVANQVTHHANCPTVVVPLPASVEG
jgi:nucleotide-binding universal stress UspA family protein